MQVFQHVVDRVTTDLRVRYVDSFGALRGRKLSRRKKDLLTMPSLISIRRVETAHEYPNGKVVVNRAKLVISIR